VGAVIYAICEYCSFKKVQKNKLTALETYLKKAKGNANGGKVGQHTLMHLMRHVHLTEDEILQLSFQSEKIQILNKSDEDDYAKSLLFAYVDSKK
jgi:hypothetical protein